MPSSITICFDDYPGPYEFLSNGFKLAHPITVFGQQFSTVWDAYDQYLKVEVSASHQYLESFCTTHCMKPGSADMEQAKIHMRCKFMSIVLFSKFDKNPSLVAGLLGTASNRLAYINDRCDNMFGGCICKVCMSVDGQNMLGKLLVELRTILAIHITPRN